MRAWCVKMGRNKKYMSDAARKLAKLASSRANKIKRVYLGKAFGAWEGAKETTGAKSDSSLAIILVDR